MSTSLVQDGEVCREPYRPNRGVEPIAACMMRHGGTRPPEVSKKCRLGLSFPNVLLFAVECRKMVLSWRDGPRPVT